MSLAVRICDLHPTTLDIIYSRLSMKPYVAFSKYNKYATVETIEFYVENNGVIHIPYLFSASLFQIIPNINIPYVPINIIFTGTLKENQVPVEQECWTFLQKYGTVILGLYPGFGKTILGAKLCCRIGLITAILVHREILTIQWKKTFEDFTSAKVWIVGEPNPPSIFNVIICMNTRWDKIEESIRNAVGLVIIDEAHAFCTPSNIRCLLEAWHPKYIIVETAYLMRDDHMESMIHAIVGNHGVYRESNKPFNVIKVCTGTKPERKQNRFGTDWSSLVRDTLMNVRRNEIILGLALSNLKYKILILTALRDHAELLHQYLQHNNISCDFLCGNKKGYIDSNVLIGTTSKIGTGFDPATSCPTYSGAPFDLLILVCSIKKYSAYVQNIGRVFRADFPIVMHLVDSDDIFVNHWNKGKRWYEARGGIINEYHIPGGEVNTQPTKVNDRQLTWAAGKAEQIRKQREQKANERVIIPR